MSAKDTERQQAIQRLREMLKPGDTVYTTVKHVSRSGMQRIIDVHIICDNRPVWIASLVSKAADYPFDNHRSSLKVSGCGMDMGFAVVYDLSAVLFPKGFKAPKPGRNGDMSGWDNDGGYALRQEWL